MLLLDTETRSEVDLKTVGAYKYATHPSTELLVMSVRLLESDKIYSWMPLHPELSPVSTADMLDMFEHDVGDMPIVAHNAEFDRLIYNHVLRRYSIRPLPTSQWIDSATMARVNGLPGSLDGACIASGAGYQKSRRGAYLIRQCCMPPFRDDPELMEELRAYCESDVRALGALVKRIRPLMQREQDDWLITQEINDRGLCIDVDLANLAIIYAEMEQENLGNTLNQLTDGAVSRTTQIQRAKKWLHERLQDNPIWNRYTDYGQRFDKAARTDLLNCPALSQPVRVVVEAVHDGNMSSVAKYHRMLDMATSDDLVRGVIVHAGAGRTQRFSSRGIQIHNLRRDCVSAEDADLLKWDMAAGNPVPQPMTTLARLLRPTIIPAPGNVLVVGDWSAIEARALPWLADTPEANKVLDVFRRDEDIYQVTADQMGMDRQIGKVAVLALGYGGAKGAFASMAAAYGLQLADDMVAKVIDRWRETNPWAPAFWAALERGMQEAFSKPGTDIEVGRVSYTYAPQLLNGTMLCELPDSTVIQYPFLKMEQTKYDYQLTALKGSRSPRVGEPWPRDRLWSGLIAENITQATAGCILRAALRHPYVRKHCVFHVHDEIVLEVPEADADTACSELRKAMEPTDLWPGLPLKAEPEVMKRYGKS